MNNKTFISDWIQKHKPGSQTGSQVGQQTTTIVSQDDRITSSKKANLIDKYNDQSVAWIQSERVNDNPYALLQRNRQLA